MLHHAFTRCPIYLFIYLIISLFIYLSSMVSLLREGVAVPGGEADPIPHREGPAEVLWREAEELLPGEPQWRAACGCD